MINLDDVTTYDCKVVVLGAAGVGKTCLVTRYAKYTFSQDEPTTVGVAYFSTTLTLPECRIKLQIWDTVGQERYHSIASMYYRGAKAAIIVYDITDSESFLRAKKWVKELRSRADEEIIILLVGNKTDLDDRRQVQKKTAANYAAEENLGFLEASAKSNRNVDKIFDEIASRLEKRCQTNINPTPATKAVNLNKSKSSSSKTCC